MKKKIVQIEYTSSSEFIPNILKGFKEILEEHSKSNQNGEILLTREEAANLLSISLVTLWKYTKEGVIPAYRIGTKLRYKKSDIIKALKKANQF
jgi:excisionase family DNA binding protein